MNSVRDIIAGIRSVLTWWVTVSPWEQAIRVRLGKRVVLLTPGIHLRIPGADKIYLQSVRMRVASLPSQTLVTKDNRALTIAVSMRYSIADLMMLYQSLHHAEGSLANIVMGAVGEFVVDHTLAECRPSVLGTWVAERAQLERYGLRDVAVTVMTYAAVRTYRLIMGDGTAWLAGDHLDTAREHSTARPDGPL